MTPHLGLRVKFNLILVPIVVLGIAVIVWADYRHEFSTLMQAHAAHTSTVGVETPTGPMEPWTLPDAAARRSLRMHALYGGALLVLLIVTVNATLTVLILRPVSLMRQRLTDLQHGRWRAGVAPGSGDEVGALYEGFQRLGPEIDALVGQVLHAEHLAAVALVSKRLESRIAPEVTTIGAIAGRLTASARRDTADDGEALGRAAATIVQALHEFDSAFAASPPPPQTRHTSPFKGAA